LARKTAGTFRILFKARPMADPSQPRACGACSLCCKLLPVAALEKPHEKWCAHCRPGAGCAIYESRPETCRSFACHWLADPAAGEYWAPLSSRMVVQITGGHDATYRRFVDVHIDRGATDAWRREPYAADLRRMSADPRTLVRVFQGRRSFIVQPGEVLEMKRG
jgi:hypothetical protein